MRPAPWTHEEGLEEYLSKLAIPGHFDDETNEYIPLPPLYQIHRGEQLIEIFDNGVRWLRPSCSAKACRH